MEEIKQKITEIASAFELFKQKNDERLSAIEKGADAGELKANLEALSAKMTELETAKGELEAKMNRQAKPEDEKQSLDKKAFGLFLRKGADAVLRDEELKSLNTLIGADGGYLVPSEINRSIYEMELDANPMRQVCDVISVETEDVAFPVRTSGAAAQWVGETEPRGKTNAPALASVKPVFGEIMAYPEATQRMLDDAFLNVEAWLQAEIANAFAFKENAAFTAGDGSNKPKGILAYPTAATADATRAYGTFEHVTTGNASTLGTNPGDGLIKLIAAVKAGYLANARWMMNANVLSAFRQVKDGQGNYIWRPGLEAGAPSTILGYPYVVNHDMADVAANALVVMFGDFRRAYKICDRVGLRVVRDELTNKPYVGFYATKRVGGMALDTQAVKMLKVSA
ncbi:MAG: phage major capsid protein [Synergistaceae bacterium]|nr:phage major capsid protein [Synergistaceae bacterium]